MSDAVLLALITAIATAIPATVASVATLIIALKNSRKLDTVQKATDGMKDALVKATRSQATEVGKAAGIEDERARAEGIASAQNPNEVR